MHRLRRTGFAFSGGVCAVVLSACSSIDSRWVLEPSRAPAAPAAPASVDSLPAIRIRTTSGSALLFGRASSPAAAWIGPCLLPIVPTGQSPSGIFAVRLIIKGQLDLDPERFMVFADDEQTGQRPSFYAARSTHGTDWKPLAAEGRFRFGPGVLVLHIANSVNYYRDKPLRLQLGIMQGDQPVLAEPIALQLGTDHSYNPVQLRFWRELGRAYAAGL